MKYDENVESRYGITLVNDKVIRKEGLLGRRESLDYITRLINHLIMYPDPTVVPVYRFEVLEEKPESRTSGWGTFKYAYEMMRLPMLSREEKDAMNTFISNRHNLTGEHVPPHVVSAKLEFPELFQFMSKVFSDGNYTDIHDGNFLKDEQGNYRIIDLEGFARYPGVDGRNGG